MFAQPLDKKGLQSLSSFIEQSDNVVVTCHVKPDGDAVGSALALCGMLSLLGKKATFVTPDTPPAYLRFLPGFNEIVAFSTSTTFAEELLNDASLIFCLDFNALYRVDRMESTLKGTKAPKVMIDHHLEPEQFADLIVSSPADSSTCFLLFKVFCQLGLRRLIDKDIATCIAAGMMTDTGNFSYNANDPQAYMAMAQLLECGIDKVAIWDKLNVKSESQLRLTGYSLATKMQLIADGRLSLIQLTKTDLDSFNYQKGDLEGVVNMPLQIPSVRISVLMHQEPDFIKVSMRSKGKYPVNVICERYFSGGGHLNAAGGEFKGSMSEAAIELEKAVYECSELFENKKEK